MKKQLVMWITIVFLSGTSVLNAQKKIWQVDLREHLYEVNWVQQSNNGLIIASGAKGLMALDNNTGEVVWFKEELKQVNKESFQNVQGLPLFFIEYVPLVGKLRGMILNAATGEIVYDTKDSNYSIKTYHLLPEQACILFELANEGHQYVMKFSLKTWEPEWTADLGQLKGLSAKVSNAVGASFIQHGPIFSQDDRIIVGLKSQIFGLDSKTGAKIWEQDTGKKIKALVYSSLNNSLYLGIRGSDRLSVINPVSGEDITPGKLKLKGTLLDIVEDAKGNLVLVETEGFNLINPQTNELIWKKSYKIEFLDEVIPYEKGYIAVGKEEKKGSVALVDENGDRIWDSKVKGYAYYVTPTNAGVLYISTERSNILSYNDGKDVWDKDVKFRAIPAVTFDEKEDKVILFENGKGYKFDLQTGVIDLFAQDIDLEKVNKKTPLTAEYLSSGYFLTADQHASLLSPEGKLVYTSYYEPASSIGGLTQVAQIGLAASGIGIDIEGSLENFKMLKDISNGSYLTSRDQSDVKSESEVMAGLYVGTEGNMATVFEITKTRYFNSKNTKENKFVLTKQKESEEGKNFILMINKASGEVVQRIQLIDKTPDYVVDEIDRRIFVNEKNHLITGYQW